MTRSRAEYAEIRQRENLARQYYERDDGLAVEPHTICLSVNSNCFMRCKMCDIGTANAGGGKGRYFSTRYGGRRYHEFPLERAKELVDEVAFYGPIIKTNFVEPLLYKRLPELAAHVVAKGLKFYTITNGWRLAKAAPWLAELPAHLVRVSLDGTAPVHDAIRGIKGAHQRALAGVEDLVRRKGGDRDRLPIIGLCYTISNHNYFNLVDFMADLDRRGLLGQVYVNFNHLLYTTAWEVEATQAESDLFGGLDVCSVDKVVCEEIEVGVLQAQIQTIQERYQGPEYHFYFSPWLRPEDLAEYYDPRTWMFPRTPCRLPWYAAQVEMSGEVGIYGHCILPSFGNVMERGFLEVWNSDRAREIRRRLKSVRSFPACNKCIGTLYPLRGRS